jgi:hypothetical protein
MPRLINGVRDLEASTKFENGSAVQENEYERISTGSPRLQCQQIASRCVGRVLDLLG